MKVIDLFEKKYQGFFAAVNAAKHGQRKPKGLSSKTWGEARKVAGKKKKKMHESFTQFLLDENVDVPDTEYGYWIRDDGKILPVNDNQGHVKVLKILGRIPSYGAAYKDGWVRVVVVPTKPDKHAPNGVLYGAIDFELGQSPSVQALYGALKVLSYHADEGMMYNIDVSNDNSVVIDSNTYSKAQAAATALKRLAQ